MNCILRSACLLVLSPIGFAQTTWFVDGAGTAPGSGTAGDPFTSIQYAIDQSSTVDGDTVLVQPGTYLESVDFSGKSLRVASSAGASATVLESIGSVVMAISGEATGTEIDGFTIQGGTGFDFVPTVGVPRVLGGGLVVIDSHLSVRNCMITGNTAQFGGGACVNGGELRMEDCEVRGNELPLQASVAVGGGVACVRGSLSLHRTVVADNILRATSGGIFSRGRGAGVYCAVVTSAAAPSLRMSDCLIENNRVEPWGRGGGIYVASSDCIIERCVVRGNSTGTEVNRFAEGAGIYVVELEQAPPATIRDCTIENNGAGTTGAGGGVWGYALLQNCVLRNNEATRGGGIHSAPSDAPARLEGCLLEGNRSDHSDVFLPSGAGANRVELFDCILRGNRSMNSGGAATNCELTRCEVLDNTSGAMLAESVEIRGGGLLDCIATDCTIAGNLLAPCQDLTVDGGGAAYNSTLTRCLIVGNKTESPGIGAATVGCELESCTVYGNEYLGGWGYVVSGPGLVRNTIIFGNAAAIDIGPYSPEPEFRFTNVEEGVMPGLGNISAAPDFWAPDRLDFHLRPGSRGIDEGDPMSPLDPDGSLIEMGAFPFDLDYYGLPTNYCTAKVNSLGCAVAMDFVGAPSLTGDDNFELTATGFPSNAFAVPVWSLSPGATPLGGGLLCVGSPFMRSAVAQAGPNTPGTCEGGSLASPFAQATMTAAGLVAGSRIYAQLWYRDNLPDGTGFALTDGLDFTIQP